MANLGFKLMPKEKAAIAALEKLAETWPESLWIFAADGVLHVMTKVRGERVMTRRGEGYDQDFIVGTVDIESDGGGW